MNLKLILTRITIVCACFSLVGMALPVYAQDEASQEGLERIARLPADSITFLPEKLSAMLWFSPDASLVATISNLEFATSRTTLWSADTGDLLATIEYPAPASYVTFSPDGSLMALAIGYYSVVVYQVADLIETRFVSLNNLETTVMGTTLIRNIISGSDLGEVRWMAFNADATLLATMDEDKLLLWDLTEPQDIEPLMTGEENTIQPIPIQGDLAPLTQSPATFDDANQVHLFSGIDRNLVGLTAVQVAPPAAQVGAPTVLADDDYVRMTTPADGVLRRDETGVTLLDPTTGTQTGGVNYVTARPLVLSWNLDMTPDGRYLATADTGLLRLWDLATGTELASAGMAFDPPMAVILSPDGTRLAVVFRTVTYIWQVNLPASTP